MGQHNPADDFLDQLDDIKSERKAKEEEDKATLGLHELAAQQLFENSVTIIENYLDALSRRTLEVGKYEIKHCHKGFTAKYWVESTYWLTGEGVHGDDDNTTYTYQYKKGFLLRLHYMWRNFSGDIRTVDESSLIVSEEALKKGIAFLYEKGPGLVVYEGNQEPRDHDGFFIIFPLPALQQYLYDLPKTRREEKLSFGSIELIMQKKLPENAYKYSPYWDAEKGNKTAWMQAGWKLDTYNLRECWVKFVRE